MVAGLLFALLAISELNADDRPQPGAIEQRGGPVSQDAKLPPLELTNAQREVRKELLLLKNSRYRPNDSGGFVMARNKKSNSATKMPPKKPAQTWPDESQRPTPNVVEQEKGKRRGIIQDERGQDQPASKEDAQLGASQPQAIWWV